MHSPHKDNQRVHASCQSALNAGFAGPSRGNLILFILRVLHSHLLSLIFGLCPF